LKGEHPRTILAKFALIWLSGFRGEDLNVIFYQNMSNLYNQYKSVERKNSQKSPAGRDGPWVGPFQMCVRQRRPVSKMATVNKNRNFFKWSKLLYFKPESARTQF
jgi:hypothetical protein